MKQLIQKMGKVYEDDYVSCTSGGNNGLVIKNNSDVNVAYINSSGSLCLLGTLYTNLNNVDSGEKSYNLLYDVNGNLIQDNSQYYEYNNLNQLIRVRVGSSSGNIIEEYVYDPNGKRIFKNVVGAITNQSIYYVGNEFVQVRNASGVFNTTYYYVNGQLITENSSSGRKYYHPDHLGSTSLITNSTAGVVEETFYLPFGEVLSGATESRLKIKNQHI